MCIAAEDHEQQPRKDAQPDDAVGKREPVALVHELARQEPIARENGREPRKIRVRCVRSQHQNEHRRDLDRVVGKPATAEDAARQL